MCSVPIVHSVQLVIYFTCTRNNTSVLSREVAVGAPKMLRKGSYSPLSQQKHALSIETVSVSTAEDLPVTCVALYYTCTPGHEK